MEISKRLLEKPTDQLPEELPTGVVIDEPLTGVKTWDNPRNRFRVVRLHYTADPVKRTKKWVDASRAGLPYIDWLREYDIRWRSFEGKPVYSEDWNAQFHIAKESLAYDPKLPVVRGWDFGLSPACLFAQLRPGGRLLILREIIGDEIAIERFSSEANRLSVEWFPEAKQFIDIVDPSGFYRKDTDERACTDIMRRGILKAKPLPGVQNPEARRSAVVRFLQRVDRGQACLQVDKSCEVLVGGFEGGYHFAYTRGNVLRDKPEKNKYSHVHDACQYICSKIEAIDLRARSAGPEIREPKYSFGKVPVDSDFQVV